MARRIKRRHERTLIAATVSAIISAAAAAQEGQPTESLEEVVVTGVRAAQRAAIDIKRESLQIVDAISAEDIGKLPDVTISDSLQRIPGVQIRRDAGEGSQVSVRGLPQVTTLLNGEQYLGANSITTVQPNFGDIPSQLFSGVEVFKSASASLVNSGVTGTVNLKTRRPFDLQSGLTVSAALEGTFGDGGEEWDPQGNLLVAWKNDRIGGLVSVAYSDPNLANYFSGLQGSDGANSAGWTQLPTESAAWPSASSDINGDGDTNDALMAFQGHTAFNRFTERERVGVNASVQFQINDALQLTADAFYTDQQQFVRTAGMAAEDKWQRWEWFTPLASTDTGATTEDGQNVITVQNFLLDTRRLKSFSQAQRTDSDSKNYNIELNFDNGGKFSAHARAIRADARWNQISSYADIDLSNGTQWGIDDNLYPTGVQNPYPNGYSGFPQISADYSGSHVNFSGIPGIVSNLDAYSIGALSSEGNLDREADMSIFRFDGRFEMSNTISFDGGVRYSERDASQFGYDLMAPFYPEFSSNGTGCLVKWKATDVVLDGGNIPGACTAGNGAGFFTALGRVPLSSFGNQVIQISDFGNASGVPAMYVLDPKAMDDPRAFHDALFPGNVAVSNPGFTYGVGVDQSTAYLQTNIVSDALPITANVGLRYINTQLDVTRSDVTLPQPYGAGNSSAGFTVTSREFNDYLPALNIAYNLKEDLKLRFGFQKTMTLLDLEQWGGALTPSYTISDAEGGRFIVAGANSNGNPELDPWRSKNFDATVEWYPARETLVAVGLFYIDVASFIQRGTVTMALPDQDGVVRRTVDVGINEQGDGGTLKGVELSTKHAFRELPGIWSNFGVDANYTFSPSDSGEVDLNGDEVPFQDNSKHQTNLALWYDSGAFDVRIAHNYRSKRAVAFDQTGTEGMTLYQSPTNYIDASVSFDVTPNVTTYLQGLNLTNEYENYYLQWENQRAFQQQYERRFILGFRARLGPSRAR